MSELMDQPLHVRRIHSLRTLLWLARGWSDFTDAPLIGLAHGVVMAAFGGVLLYFGWSHFWALVGAFSGFLMVSPICRPASTLSAERSTKGKSRVGTPSPRCGARWTGAWFFSVCS